MDRKVIAILHAVKGGHLIPNSDCQVCPYVTSVDLYHRQPFDLVYSHAALEPAWAIQETWEALRSVTASGGWHSHRIDLANHGRRELNFVEMFEWPEWAYQLTMRFIPGAINRWRASQHIDYLQSMGFAIVDVKRHTQRQLLTKRSMLAEPFGSMDEQNLRITAVDITARLFM